MNFRVFRVKKSFPDLEKTDSNFRTHVAGSMVNEISHKILREHADLIVRVPCDDENRFGLATYVLDVGIPSREHTLGVAAQIDDAYVRGLDDAKALAQKEFNRLMSQWGAKMAHGAEVAANSIAMASRNFNEDRSSQWRPMPNTRHESDCEFLFDNGAIVHGMLEFIFPCQRDLSFSDEMLMVGMPSSIKKTAIGWRKYVKR